MIKTRPSRKHDDAITKETDMVSRKAIQALQMLGAVEQDTLSIGYLRSPCSKYRVFDTRTQRYFVGYAGALRLAARGDSLSKSQSITNTPTHRHLATLGEFPRDIANPREVYQHIRRSSRSWIGTHYDTNTIPQR